MKKILFVLALLFATTGVVYAANDGCGGWFEPDCNKGGFAEDNQKLREQQEKLAKAHKVPVFERSQERANIVKRLELFNSDEKVSYIYLTSFGRVMAFYTVKGKVSSVNSYLTASEQLVREGGEPCKWSSPVGSCYVVEAPDNDGSYGSNGDGVFFFTTEGAYVEWNGEYMLSDQPLKLTTQPELVRQVK